MYNIIEESLVSVMRPTNIIFTEKFVVPSELERSIKKCLGEDKDEFIFYCIDYFIDNIITETHKKFAIAKKIKLSGNINIDTLKNNFLDISNQEAFNIIFRDTFKMESTMKEFWQQNESLCYRYYLTTYFKQQSIFYVPWYNLFSLDGTLYSNNIGYLIALKQLY
jgi:hypothetical protein